MAVFDSNGFLKKGPVCEMEDNRRATNVCYFQKTFDIWECLRFCLKKWLLILGFAAVCAGIVCLAYSFTAPSFESTAKLYILAPNDAGIQTSDLQAGSMLLSDYREVFKTWEFHEMVQQQVRTNLTYQQLQNILTVETPDDTRLVYITIRHQNAMLACDLANACAHAARLFIEEHLHGLQPATFSTAIVPSVPSGLSASLWTMIAFAFGAALAIGICVLVFCLDDRIRTVEELKTASGLTVLADESDSDSMLLASRLISCNAKCVLLTGDAHHLDEHSVGVNLLNALASLHRKTVLIRVEHSDDSQSRISDYLEGQCDADALLQPSGSPNAFILPIRSRTEEVPVQLYHPRMQQLISSFIQQFDMVLICTEPVDKFADAGAFFSFCSGIVVTITRGQSRMKRLAAQIALLKDAGCCLLGAVWVPSARRNAKRSFHQGAAA